MIGTGAAILGSAVLGLGGSLYAANQSSKAAETQSAASREGSMAQIIALLQAQGFQRENAEKAAAAITGALPSALSAIGGGTDNALAALRAGAGKATGALQPYADTGNRATYTLASLYGLNNDGKPAANALEILRNSPDYQFAQTQGMRALESSNAAKGLLRSSQHLRSTQEFGQGLASQQYGNFVARLGALSQMGYGANNALAGIYGGLGTGEAGIFTGQGNALANLYGAQGTGLANVYTGTGNALAQLQAQIGGAQNAGITGAGAATAAGLVGGANAINAGLSNAGNSLMLYQLLNRNQPTPGTTTPTWMNSTFNPTNWAAYSNPTGFTVPTAPTGTGIWPV